MSALGSALERASGVVRLRGGLTIEVALLDSITTRAGMVGRDVAVAEYLAKLGEAYGFAYDALRDLLIRAVDSRMSERGMA